MFQIEFFINEFQKSNENIQKKYDHEYIEGSLLFNRKFMQIYKFYIFIIGKFG
jgi:hypothetical protein